MITWQDLQRNEQITISYITDLEKHGLLNNGWLRDVYMGAYSSTIDRLEKRGLLECRSWFVPNTDLTFGCEYRPTQLARDIVQDVPDIPRPASQPEDGEGGGM